MNPSRLGSYWTVLNLLETISPTFLGDKFAKQARARLQPSNTFEGPLFDADSLHAQARASTSYQRARPTRFLARRA